MHKSLRKFGGKSKEYYFANSPCESRLTGDQIMLLAALRRLVFKISGNSFDSDVVESMSDIEYNLKKINGFLTRLNSEDDFVLPEIKEVKYMLKNTEEISLSAPLLLGDVLRNMDTFIRKFESAKIAV